MNMISAEKPPQVFTLASVQTSRCGTYIGTVQTSQGWRGSLVFLEDRHSVPLPRKARQGQVSTVQGLLRQAGKPSSTVYRYHRTPCRVDIYLGGAWAHAHFSNVIASPSFSNFVYSSEAPWPHRLKPGVWEREKEGGGRREIDRLGGVDAYRLRLRHHHAFPEFRNSNDDDCSKY